MSELKKIEGKTFLITGGASELGAGYAQAFLENGAKKGLVSLTYKGLEHMHKDGGVGGTIVNISSTAAFGRFPYVPAYSGSKAGVLHFSNCLAVDPFHEVTGVRIISMCIGPTETPIFNNMDQISYDERSGKAMAQLLSSLNYQRPESAVSSVVEAFKQGTNGSIWFSVNDKPVKDITLAYNQAQDFLTKAINSDL
ncbi:alcohol dehydrogenase 2-like [Ostrinia nubilalis]|uniref:alcohol dehydrogenase 2-like n=1 Tax=Ostrinia nubilalis TaxID=29057 RepID=UPI0030826291